MGSRRRTFGSLAARVAVFGLLGAAINIVVAWGCAALIEARLLVPYGSWATWDAYDGNGNCWGWEARPGALRVMRFSCRKQPNDLERPWAPRGEVPEWSVALLQGAQFQQQPPENAPILWDEGVEQVVDARGWPLLSMYGSIIKRVRLPSDPAFAQADEIVIGTILCGHLLPQDRLQGALPVMLPTRPVWPGFAINTAFYAAICWLTFARPFAVRRQRRIKRGLCPACAYPVGTSDLCTECGKPVAPKRVEPAK